MPIYMKIEGIDGSCQAVGHEKWIVIESCQFGVNRVIASASGAGTSRDKSTPSLSEIVVTKNMEHSSSELFKASLWGTGKKVNINFVKTGGGGPPEKYFEIELESTLISSYSFSGHGGDGSSAPMESLSLNFAKITTAITEFDDKNKAGKPLRASYDLKIQKGA